MDDEEEGEDEGEEKRDSSFGASEGGGAMVFGILNGSAKVAVEELGSLPDCSGFQSFKTPPVGVRLSSTLSLSASYTARSQPCPARPFVAWDMSSTRSGRRCLPSVWK
jgi:hypothetical protein